MITVDTTWDISIQNKSMNPDEETKTITFKGRLDPSVATTEGAINFAKAAILATDNRYLSTFLTSKTQLD